MRNSRYLKNIESKLQSAQDREVTLALKAELASYYARRGDIGLAKSLVAEIRFRGDGELSGRVTAWVNISEGLIEHYSGRQDYALEKWVRAKAIAKSTGCNDLASLAAAWLSFSAYLSEDLERLGVEACSAIALIDSENAKSLSRLCLTMALCFHYAGDMGAAGKNYARARVALLREGDEIGLAALIHDMAWMSVTRTRNLKLACSHGVEAMPVLLQSSAESACSYEDMVGVSVSPSLGSLLLAQAEMNDSKWRDAIIHIDEGFDASSRDGFDRLMPGLLADRAYCCAELGLIQESMDGMSRCFLAMADINLHADDHAVLLSRIEQTYGLLNLPEDKKLYACQAKLAWEKVKRFQSELHELVKSLDAKLDSRVG